MHTDSVTESRRRPLRLTGARALAALASAALVLLAAGCANTNARTDFDPSADFSRFHTYVWAGGKDMTTQGALENSLVDKRVKQIVTRQLTAKGLTEVAEGQPSDLVVRYWVGVKEKQSIESVPGGAWGYGPYGPYWGGRWGPAYDQIVVNDYHEGTLIIDLIDAASKDLAWRAYLVQTLDRDLNKTAAKAEKNAEAAFTNYPPRKDSK